MVALTKRDFAAHRGVTASAVSQYIARGLLSGRALRPDGKVDEHGHVAPPEARQPLVAAE
jgi:hypothetical protein